jgi:hypothetical protein
MDRDIATALGRLDRYLFRIKRAIRQDDWVVALADTAELAEISRRLWIQLEKTIKASGQNKAENNSPPCRADRP